MGADLGAFVYGVFGAPFMVVAGVLFAFFFIFIVITLIVDLVYPKEAAQPPYER